MLKKNNKEKKIEIETKNEDSSLLEFTKRPLPTENEIEEFDKIIEDEVKEDEIEDSLSEIYYGDKSDGVDIKKLDIKKRKGFFFYFFSFIFLVSFFLAVGCGVYYYIFNTGSDATAIEFKIEGEDKITAGEEFFWTVSCKNLSSINLKNIRIDVSYPENFIFLDSFPVLNNDNKEKLKIENSFWEIESIPAKGSYDIKIKGKIISEKDSSGILLAKISYIPENFSSEFKKEASFVSTVSSLGFDFNFDYPSTVLVGEDNDLIISLNSEKDLFLNSFYLEAEPYENLKISFDYSEEENNIKVEEINSNLWFISNISEDKDELKIKYNFKEKPEEKGIIDLKFFYKAENEEKYYFLEKNFSFEVMKSDLNLSLIINGGKGDQTVDFGEKLNYSIVYANKGEVTLKDVVIMAVLESDFLDWTKLEDNNQGTEKGNTITWTKEEIPALEELGQEEEGVIDFSIDVSYFKEADLGKKFIIKSYAQFVIGNEDEIPEIGDEEDSKNYSNTIINNINSDLLLEESVRYFNDDNIPVGQGPLPPKAGEETILKVYWTLTNNVHELRDAKIEVILPEYVKWSGKERTSVGNLYYDEDNHKIIWDIGRMPITVYRSDAEFNISVIPKEEDKNKIMVLLPGTLVKAFDVETNSQIDKNTKAKTTKLEDDKIAEEMGNDGIVD